MGIGTGLPRVLRAEQFEQLLREEAARRATTAPMAQLVGNWGQRIFGKALAARPQGDAGRGPIVVPASKLLRGVIR